ncbi:MAG TPA: ATP-binding protein, partial [Stellaceae bacterium]|nr:ATP-binding protein [Stellaceae bacterium]
MSLDPHALEAMLTRLHLTAIRDQLDSLLDEAARRELTLRDAMAFLCERELERRTERRVEMATKIAHFPTLRDLDGFDFQAQPSIDKKQIRELAACRWVAHGDALLLLGPPGVGKTHLAVALGRAAIREGYSVLFVTAPALVASLAKAHVEARLDERLGFFAEPKPPSGPQNAKTLPTRWCSFRCRHRCSSGCRWTRDARRPSLRQRLGSPLAPKPEHQKTPAEMVQYDRDWARLAFSGSGLAPQRPQAPALSETRAEKS